MHDSENKRSWPSLLLKYVLPVFLFLILIIAPYMVARFNDIPLQRFYASFPHYDKVKGILGSKLQDIVKNKYYTLFTVNKSSYRLYETVHFQFAIVDKEKAKVIKNLQPLLIVRTLDGRLVPDILGRTEIPLQYHHQNVSYVHDWMPEPTFDKGEGQFQATLSIRYDAFSKPVEETVNFTISPYRGKPLFPQGYAILGLDSKEILGQRSILSINNKETFFGTLADWFPLLNVNAVYLPTAFSKTYDTNQGVWDETKITESFEIAKTIKQSGVDIALGVQMMELDGIEAPNLGYKETPYTGKDQLYIERSVVSLQDQKRSKDLSMLLQRMQENNNIKYIALSKIFFTKQYNNDLFPIFQDYSQNSDRLAFEKWQRFQAVEYIRTVLQEVKGTKPYVAMLTIEELNTDPELLDMAFSAGVDSAIISIKATPKQSEEILSYFAPKFSEYLGRLGISFSIDYNDYVSEHSSSLETWKERNLSALGRYGFSSLYINDFYKALFGKRGPYPAYEWLLAIASMVSEWKKSLGLGDLSVSIMPLNDDLGSQVNLAVSLHNRGQKILSNTIISLLSTIDLSSRSSEVLKIPILNAGQIIRTNIIVSNIQYRPTVLQRRTMFLALHVKVGAEIGEVILLPFQDTNVAPDQAFQGFVETNKGIQRLILEEKPKEKEVSNIPTIPKQEKAVPKKSVQPQTQKEKKDTNENKEKEEPKKKLSFAERRRLERLERERKKKEEEKEKEEAKKKKK